jgi:hypothetical protein
MRPPRSPAGCGEDEHVVVNQSPPDQTSGESIDATMPPREPANPRVLHAGISDSSDKRY